MLWWKIGIEKFDDNFKNSIENNSMQFININSLLQELWLKNNVYGSEDSHLFTANSWTSPSEPLLPNIK